MNNGDAKNILRGMLLDIVHTVGGRLPFSQREAIQTAIDAMTESDSLRAGLEELQATHDALLNVSGAGVRSLDAKIDTLQTQLNEATDYADRLAFYAGAYATRAEDAGYTGDAKVAREVVADYREFVADVRKKGAADE